MNSKYVLFAILTFLVSGCSMESREITFGDDLTFLKKHINVVVLSDSTGKGRVIVSPELQGRILTSTGDGLQGLSYGWINRDLIASGEFVKHFNPFGGEDRFWLGPEGGQYSIFFKQRDPFDLKHWFTPAAFDTESFVVLSRSDNTILMTKETQLTNYSNTRFTIQVKRGIRVLNRGEAVKAVGIEISESLKMVAFESQNVLMNTGDNVWTKENGLLSIWILGMFNPSPATTVVIPFVAGDEEDLGPIVNDSYFGKVPTDRLVVNDDVLFFSGDGKYRSKIGLSPLRAKPVLGSYDAANKVLTVVMYTKPDGKLPYVNSMWEIQESPYNGDVLNSYNDGPPGPGVEPLGPFFELETSSPAAALAPQESIEHVHRTFHFQGDSSDLDKIAQSLLGVSLDDIISVFE